MRSVRRIRRRGATVLYAFVIAVVAMISVPVGNPAAVADPDFGSLQVALRTVATGLTKPVAMASRPGDGRMYVAQQGGVIKLVDVASGNVSPTPVLSITVAPGGERGLLGLAFSADGSKLYIDYTDTGGTIKIVEYQMGADTAITASRRELLAIPHSGGSHNGGQVAIGPDGFVYVSVGDNGGPANAQNLNNLLGKIIRIDPTPSGGLEYTIPPDNPFVGQANTRGEIWMYGLRNPWRFTFDRDTGDMYIGDVGQGLYEEVNYAAAGEKGINWGWPLREGFHEHNGPQPPDGRDPLLEASHDDGYCALIGGYMYRGEVLEHLQGAYVFGDYCRPSLIGVATSGGVVDDQQDLGLGVSPLSAVGEDNDGELYFASLSGGSISKLVPSVPSVVVGDASLVEGNAGTTTVSVPLTLSSPAVDSATVAWTTANGTATSPGDFSSASGTVFFAEGETTATVSVPIVGDEVPEKAETFQVKLSAPSGVTVADATATVNVLDDDAPISVGASDVVVVEGNSGTAVAGFNVSLSRPVPTGAAVSVTASTADGSAKAGLDYTAVGSTVLSYAAGEQTKSLPVSVLGESVVEGNESFKLNLKSPVGAVIADTYALGTVVNDDGTPSPLPAPSVAAGDATVVEGDAGSVSVSVPVSLSSSSASSVTVAWTTTDGAAKAPGDYTPTSGTVTFDPGETAATVSVSVVGDGVSEKSESFQVKLSAPSGATLADAAATVNVLDNDAPISVGVTDVRVVEGNAGTTAANFSVSLSRPVPSGATVSVKVSTANGSATAGSDFTAVVSTVLTFGVGEQTKSVPVSVFGETVIEKHETFKLTLKQPVGAVLGDLDALATIANDD